MHYSIAFDVELDRLVPEEWNTDSSPHITCAATYNLQSGIKTYFSSKENLQSPKMTFDDCAKLLDDLWEHTQKGAMIISWGGTAVDFRALHYCLHSDATRQNKVKQIALHHIDIPIASATDTGMMMGLASASKGLMNTDKSIKNSSLAPKLWSEGKFQEVLRHVELDAILTLNVYNNIFCKQPFQLEWITKSGFKKTWFCSSICDPNRREFRLCSVSECLTRPLPPVPFSVVDGMNRDKITKWLISFDIDK